MAEQNNSLDIIKQKSIAIASGKGGVGKTTTCVNLAVYYARAGLKTAILDLDPLSDTATLLDIAESEAILKKNDGSGAGSWKIQVLPKLDLLFPDSDPENRDSAIYRRFIDESGEIAETYDIILFDLPAGSLYEENLVFLQHTERVIIVTNDEPTSHTASGHYIKAAWEAGCRADFLLWHNKYAGITVAGFDPTDLPGNYNKNVAAEDSFDFSLVNMRDAAFIPNDPAMDLLRANPSLPLNILAQMGERLDFLIEQRIDELCYAASLPPRAGGLIRHYLHLNPFIRDVEASYRKLSEYIFVIMNTRILSDAGPEYHKLISRGGVSLFTDSERKNLSELLVGLMNDSLLSELLRCSAQIKVAVDSSDNSNRLFFSEPDPSMKKAVDRRLSRLLQILHEQRNNHNSYMKSTAGLLLFDFSLHKLMSSETVNGLITNFIPTRMNSRGIDIRDKHKQIMQLITEDGEYKKRYLNLIDTLFPVCLRQIAAIVETFGTAGLLFRNSSGIQKDVYLKLLSAFLHNSINSGLGIVVGFPFRPASTAFGKAADGLLKAETAPSI